jgi:type III restriction enzyme
MELQKRRRTDSTYDWREVGEQVSHHALDKDGQPLELPPVAGRRSSELITPVPRPRKKRQTAAADQARMILDAGDDLSSAEEEYNERPGT